MGPRCQNPEQMQIFTENFKLYTVFPLFYIYAYPYAP